ncbi:MAG: ABC transporter ATP-binding protein [Chloroflexota bacterium]|nr:ABC transporter ATP-binding protein [Chloroflexota bacterium]
MYLTLDHLTKKFPARGKQSGDVVAVDDVSLDIEKGQFVTLLGPSGCGKTTTLRLIAGFEFPTTGHLTLDGQHLEDVPPNRRDMAMVFQSYAIFPHLSVFENIAYGLKIRKLSASEIKRRAEDVMALTQLTGLHDRAPNQLSGGQQQRVALARALVVEPKVLLFDEPLSNLDAKLREQMRTEIRRIQQRLKITSVYVTHDQAEAMTMSDRIVVMHAGHIEQVGTAVDLYQRPNSPFVADFIGKANFMEATVVARSDRSHEVDLNGQRLAIPHASQDFAVGTPVTLVARPEGVELHDDEGVAGTVRRVAYLGSVIDYDVDVDGQTVSVVVYDPRRKALRPEGSPVRLTFIEESLYLLPKRP